MVHRGSKAKGASVCSLIVLVHSKHTDNSVSCNHLTCETKYSRNQLDTLGHDRCVCCFILMHYSKGIQLIFQVAQTVSFQPNKCLSRYIMHFNVREYPTEEAIFRIALHNCFGRGWKRLSVDLGINPSMQVTDTYICWFQQHNETWHMARNVWSVWSDQEL